MIRGQRPTVWGEKEAEDSAGLTPSEGLCSPPIYILLERTGRLGPLG